MDLNEIITSVLVVAVFYVSPIAGWAYVIMDIRKSRARGRMLDRIDDFIGLDDWPRYS